MRAMIEAMVILEKREQQRVIRHWIKLLLLRKNILKIVKL